jgi:hypothetical protein
MTNVYRDIPIKHKEYTEDVAIITVVRDEEKTYLDISNHDVGYHVDGEDLIFIRVDDENTLYNLWEALTKALDLE